MENQNWKIGKHFSTVVSDTKVINTNFPSPPNEKESTEADVEYYGGYLVCESIGNCELARLIAAAPEMLQALKVLIGEIEKAPVKYTRQEKINLAKAAIKKATQQ